MSRQLLIKLEFGAALALTLLAVYFRYSFATHAGGLWRDEANTVGLSTLPTLSEIWKNLQFDSFPLLWPLLLRTLITLGLESDFSLRLIGFAISLVFLAGLWFAAKLFKSNRPVVSLLLLGLCPSVICWGGTMRAYGMGMMIAVFMIPLLWKFIETGETLWFLAQLAVCLLGVHTLYYNAVVIFVCSIGGCAVLVPKKDWKTIFLLLGSGAFCAVTLLPYYFTIRGASDWNMLCQIDTYDLGFFLSKLTESLGSAGVVGIGLWIFVLASASLVSVLLVLKKESKIHPTGSRDLALFSLVTLWLGIFCYYLFLQLLHYPTQPWYYLILLVLVGVLCDGILVSATAFKNGLSVAVLLAVFFGVVLTFQPVNNTATIRLTNSDLVAAKLEKEAGEHDLVLMNPWYLGVSFNRYYHGKADWLTLPTLNYFRFHRYDQVKTQMMQPLQSEVVDPILQRMDATLKSGGKVFIVGGLRFLAENESPFYLPPAPNSPFKWQDGPYYISWSSQVASHLVAHITDASLLDVPSPQEVNPFENSPILVVSGWRP